MFKEHVENRTASGCSACVGRRQSSQVNKTKQRRVPKARGRTDNLSFHHNDRNDNDLSRPLKTLQHGRRPHKAGEQASGYLCEPRCVALLSEEAVSNGCYEHLGGELDMPQLAVVR